MKYILRIIKSQADHVGDPLPVQEFRDRFITAKEAADFAEALIREHNAPLGAYTFDVLDSAGQRSRRIGSLDMDSDMSRQPEHADTDSLGLTRESEAASNLDKIKRQIRSANRVHLVRCAGRSLDELRANVPGLKP